MQVPRVHIKMWTFSQEQAVQLITEMKISARTTPYGCSFLGDEWFLCIVDFYILIPASVMVIAHTKNSRDRSGILSTSL